MVLLKPTTAQASMLKDTDVLSAKQFDKEKLQAILNTAFHYEQALKEKRRLYDMDGKIMASLFFEPSTRTRLSFETAMQRLGGTVVTVSESPQTQSSSVAKGETLHDTIAVVDSYVDVIVMRSPLKGAGVIAANAAQKPVINGGDGVGEHPTQALLDIYTIAKEKGKLDGLKVVMVGDLKNGRTVHSLSRFMALYGNDMIFVSPKELMMPVDLTAELRQVGARIKENEDLAAMVKQADVLYVTRVQKERFSDPEEFERVKDMCIVNNDIVKDAKEGMVIMHPLPRVNEIAVSVDRYPGSAYFRQPANGVPIRMALLAMVTGNVKL